MFDSELSVLSGQSQIAPYTTGGRAKRIFDIFFASITLLALLPLFVFVATNWLNYLVLDRSFSVIGVLATVAGTSYA